MGEKMVILQYKCGKKDKFCEEVQNKKYERQKNNCRGFYRRNKL